MLELILYLFIKPKTHKIKNPQFITIFYISFLDILTNQKWNILLKTSGRILAQYEIQIFSWYQYGTQTSNMNQPIESTSINHYNSTPVFRKYNQTQSTHCRIAPPTTPNSRCPTLSDNTSLMCQLKLVSQLLFLLKSKIITRL